MFDVKAQDFSKAAAEGYTFELELPTGAPSGAFLTIIGDMSPEVKTFSKRKFKEYQMQQEQAKRRGKEYQLSLDDAEEANIEAALVRLIDWKGITEDGKEIKFSKEKAEEILRQHGWIRDAIIEEAKNVANFTPKPMKA